MSALFAQNSDWTLTVQDQFSNVVKTATGSGETLDYDWDGTSDGGTNLDPGVYYYYISAMTNGLGDAGGGGSGTNGGGGPPPPAMSSDPVLWTLSSDAGEAVPVSLYPLGFETNSLTMFSASPAEIALLSQESSSSVSGSGALTPAAAGGSFAAAQNAPAAPQRKPTNPIVGVAGLFGIGYDTYTANGTNAMTAPLIQNIPGVTGSYISLDGYPGSSHMTYAPLRVNTPESANFTIEMRKFGWKDTINEADDKLNINDLTGSGTPFNNVSLGVLIFHGAYGTTADFQAGNCKNIYFPVTAGGTINYLRLSDMNLGGTDPTNGLKWCLIHACDSLHQANWNSMIAAGKQPFNSHLHMMLGGNSVTASSNYLLQRWADYMTVGTNSFPLTIHDAWFLAARNAYAGHHFTNTVYMAVASDSNCTDDYLQKGFNSPPTGTWTYESQQVWP